MAFLMAASFQLVGCQSDLLIDKRKRTKKTCTTYCQARTNKSDLLVERAFLQRPAGPLAGHPVSRFRSYV